MSPTQSSGSGDTEPTGQTFTSSHLLALSPRLYVLSRQTDCKHGEKESDFILYVPEQLKWCFSFVYVITPEHEDIKKLSLTFLNVHKNRIA